MIELTTHEAHEIACIQVKTLMMAFLAASSKTIAIS